MSKKLYLFRHPESIDNMNMLFSGRRDLGLSETGIRNSHLIKEELKDVKFDIAYTSPAKRCKDAIEIVLECHPRTKIIEDSRILERSYGLLEGKSKTNLPLHIKLIKTLTYRAYFIPPPGGESFYQIWKRVTPFINDILESAKHIEHNILVCAHHNSMRPIIAHFEKRSKFSLLTDKSQNRDVKVYSLH